MTVKTGILSELLNSIVNEHIEVIDLSQVLKRTYTCHTITRT